MLKYYFICHAGCSQPEQGLLCFLEETAFPATHPGRHPQGRTVNREFHASESERQEVPAIDDDCVFRVHSNSILL